MHVKLKIDRVIKLYSKSIFGNETNSGRSLVKEAFTSHSRNENCVLVRTRCKLETCGRFVRTLARVSEHVDVNVVSRAFPQRVESLQSCVSSLPERFLSIGGLFTFIPVCIYVYPWVLEITNGQTINANEKRKEH